jgi:hypothetical protein
MATLARLSLALSTALAPVLVLSQEAGGQATPAQRSDGSMNWLWIIAAIAIAVVLFRMFSRRRHQGPHAPGRTP